jgi:hypothetical protein
VIQSLLLRQTTNKLRKYMVFPHLKKFETLPRVRGRVRYILLLIINSRTS